MTTTKDPNCAYCMEGALVDAFGIKICELPASKVYLFKEQSHRGRVIVASKYHVSEMVDLTAAGRRAFLDDVASVAEALHKLFQPAKVNYGAYGDTGCHLHFHLVPKYKDDEFEWGGTFAMNPKRTFLSDAEYAALVSKIAEALRPSAGQEIRDALVWLRHAIADDGRIDFGESGVLLETLKPYVGSDARIAELVIELVQVRQDGAVTPRESEKLIRLLDGLIV